MQKIPKISIRNIRRDFIESYKKQKELNLSEDELKKILMIFKK